VVACWIALNVLMLLHPPTLAILRTPLDQNGHDYQIWAQIPERLESGTLYDGTPGYHYVFAPATAWILALVIPLGYPLWIALHFVLLPLLGDWRLIALAVASVSFWVDTMIGSTNTFLFIAGAIALRGSTAGAIGYLALFLLMPRPLYLPLAAWLVWKRRDLRAVFAALAALLVMTTLASGYAVEWGIELLVFGGFTMSEANPDNISPTRWLGPAWLVLGIPLATLLTLKGKVGIAGVAMTPYLGASSLMIVLWDLWRAAGRSGTQTLPKHDQGTSGVSGRRW
jgi:hypothetical protein